MTALARRDTEIIPAPNSNGQLPDLGLASDYVDQLVANGDEDTLRWIRDESKAAIQFLHERAESLKQMNHFARLKLLAEAGLGSLLLADGQRPKGRSRFTHWRALAIGQRRGVMGDVCDEIEREGLSITTTRVAGRLEVQGWTRTHAAALQERVDRCVRERGISKSAFAREINIFPSTLSPSYAKRGKSMEWPNAARIAEAIGIDPLSLPPRPLALDPRRPRKVPMWLARERKRTGGKWDKAYGYFRQCLSEFQELAPNQDPVWDEAYAHFYAIEQLIGRQLSKERTGR